jgi:hypothetical protein
MALLGKPKGERLQKKEKNANISKKGKHFKGKSQVMPF